MLQKTPLFSSEPASRSFAQTDQRAVSAKSAGPLERELSYPGELLNFDHQTISLRTQLRLSYETYAWLRYLTWTGLALLGFLLLILPGFPPRALVQFLQMLPLAGSLLSMHGASALFSLAMLAAQALTWLVLWGLWAALCHALARYTWRLRNARSFLASAWQPSLLKSQPQTQAARSRSAATSTGGDPSANAGPAFAPGTPSTRDISVNVAPALVPGAATQPRQFVPASVPLARPRVPSSSGEFSSSWPSIFTNNASGVAWDVGITRRGRPNEDSVLTLRGTCNFAENLQPFELHIVADGMGGHAHGRLASHLAIRSMLETVVPGLVTCASLESESIVDILIDGVHWSNQVIHQYGQEQRTDLGTTITAVLLLDETAYIINVGDSRTYIFRPGVGLTQITRDHSLVARLVETGAITPDEVYTHPDRNKVYRGLGDKMDVTVDWFVLPVQNGDLLLLCSDGLWEMVRDPQIAAILQTYASSPALASNALLRAALESGGNDNVSLLVARVQ